MPPNRQVLGLFVDLNAIGPDTDNIHRHKKPRNSPEKRNDPKNHIPGKVHT